MNKKEYIELRLNKMYNSNWFSSLKIDKWSMKVLKDEIEDIVWLRWWITAHIEHLEKTLTKRNRLIKKLRKKWI
jgi:hypothetical protein